MSFMSNVDRKDDTKVNNGNIASIDPIDLEIENIPFTMIGGKRYPDRKNKKSGYLVIEETPKFHQYLTAEFIHKHKYDTTQSWVYKLSTYNKLDEKHNLLCANDDFRAYIDTDCTHYDVVAILKVKKYPHLKTIRDIRGEHHGMLLKLKNTVLNKTKFKYGINENDITIYAQYLVRKYAFVLHFHFVDKEHPTKKIHKFRHHFLVKILQNIKKDPYHYRDARVPLQIFFDYDNPRYKDSFYEHIRPFINKKKNLYKRSTMAWRSGDQQIVNDGFENNYGLEKSDAFEWVPDGNDHEGKYDNADGNEHEWWPGKKEEDKLSLKDKSWRTNESKTANDNNNKWRRDEPKVADNYNNCNHSSPWEFPKRNDDDRSWRNNQIQSNKPTINRLSETRNDDNDDMDSGRWRRNNQRNKPNYSGSNNIGPLKPVQTKKSNKRFDRF